MSDSRVDEIIDWLSESALARRYVRGEGFYVASGPIVRLADGDSLDLLEWLVEEGINGEVTTARYTVTYFGPDSEHGERMSFLKAAVVDAPFSRLPSEEYSVVTLEDDIPF